MGYWKRNTWKWKEHSDCTVLGRYRNSEKSKILLLGIWFPGSTVGKSETLQKITKDN